METKVREIIKSSLVGRARYKKMLPKIGIGSEDESRNVIFSSIVPILVLTTLAAIMASLPASATLHTSKETANSPAATSSQQMASKLPNDKINLIEADENGLYLVGLFDVHQSNPRVPFKCGQIDTDAGEWQSRRSMQNLQAFLWAIEQVNADKYLLPGVRLGSLVIDTCSSFLRTNQQLANLLHDNQNYPANRQHQQDTKQLLPNVRQTLAIVADNSDWQSVQAVASMASAVGLSTFVTQSKSTKLTEFARKYLPANQLDLSAEANLAELPSSMMSHRSSPGPDVEANMQHQFEGFLGELLGIGKMTTPSSTDDDVSVMFGSANNSSDNREPSVTADQSTKKLDSQKLLMVKMLLGNELLAEAISSLVVQMNWDLISIVYDDEPDMIDLHDELARQLFSRNIQFGLDEQVPVGSKAEVYDKLLANLAKKSQNGSRVVITLLSTGSSRSLLDSLRQLRSINQRQQEQQVKQINSLLWITIADREPYFSFATDALGTVAISSSSSLIQEFKNYYDRLPAGRTMADTPADHPGSSNRWWPEYLKSIILKHRRDIELISNECARWQEPHASPLNEKCRSMTLLSLSQAESKVQLKGSDSSLILDRSRRLVGADNSSSQETTASPRQVANPSSRKLKLSKYLAGGWEHNGMDVINSVLAVANGLESIRQTLCPESRVGICERMRELIYPSAPIQMLNERDLLPTLSELIYNELLRSTFQLADGRMFNLDDSNSLGGQLEGKVKLYNLRYLQQNLIGFVKFGHYDQHEGLTLNASKAKYYPTNAYLSQTPIERLNSTCEDERKCLMLRPFQEQSVGQRHPGADNNGGHKQIPLSEEELAAGVNSLFKLDHPWNANGGDVSKPNGTVSEQQSQQRRQDSHVHTMRSPIGMTAASGRQFNEWKPFEATTAPAGVRSLPPSTTAAVLAPSIERQTFNTIVLLPLHNKGYQSSAASNGSGQLDTSHSFQHLVALAYAQTLLNGHDLGESTGASSSHQFPSNHRRLKNGSEPQIELTTTVIDYCDSQELAREKLSAILDEWTSQRQQQQQQGGSQQLAVNRPVAVIDFDNNVSERVDELVMSAGNILHLTVGLPAAQPSAKSREPSAGEHLRISLLPSKENEIAALVRLLGSLSEDQWKLVHLIYTDSHHYRDEFVRRANEANICVSKLIWIPAANPDDHFGSDQLNKTRRLFARELHDYYDETKTATTTSSQPDEHAAQGLNSTKILVVLASSNEQTNRIIQAAATESMLDHYVWLTSHEWLYHIELPAEKSGQLDGDRPQRLPRHFVSTRLESLEAEGFKRYFSHLTPAIHSPIPTSLFDEFWQQQFKCKLPFVSPANEVTTGRLCEANEHLHMHEIIEDDRVHYTIRAIESIHFALEAMQQGSANFSGQQFAAKFREAFDGAGSGSKTQWRSPFGLHFVHRILQATQQDSNNGASTSRRRSNSRELPVSPEASLQVIGLWRNNKLILWRDSAAQHSSSTSSPPVLGRLPSDGGNGLGDEAELEAIIKGSLNRLAAVKSRCSLAKTCDLCREQIEQTMAMIKQEQVRLRQSELVSEPNAISSIWHQLVSDSKSSSSLPAGSTIFSGGQAAGNSILDSISSSNFDDESTSTNAPVVTAQSKRDLDLIQAAASSLFDASTSQQIERQRQSDIRRAYEHMMQLSGHKNSAASSSRSTSSLVRPTHSRLASGTLVAVLSLAGVVCVLIGMVYLYPNMDGDYGSNQGERLLRFDSQSSIASSTMTGGTKRPSQMTSSHSTDSFSCFNDVSSFNDFFLLAGLLMLYSINIALLLPATKGVCWFRRIGLPVCYTVIFASVLVKIVSVNLRRKPIISPKRSTWNNARPNGQTQQKPAQFDSIEESVEVTFESLPYESQGADLKATTDPHVPTHQQQIANCSTISQPEQLTNGYQTQAGQKCQLGTNGILDGPMDEGNLVSVATPMTIYGTLIAGQLLVSIMWLSRQPPEPTLYLGCWFCSSPIRSPVMFLHEPLLSLLFPSIILILSWICAIIALRQASIGMEQFNSATRQLLSSNPNRSVHNGQLFASMSTLNCWQINAKKEQFGSQFRNAKCLLITTTLLALTWSLISLKMISTSRKLMEKILATSYSSSFASITSMTGSSPGSNGDSTSTQIDDLSLVYGNILSGTIIFLMLFVFRLQIFTKIGALLSCRCVKFIRSPRYHSDKQSISSHVPSNLNSPLTFNGVRGGSNGHRLRGSNGNYNVDEIQSTPRGAGGIGAELTLFSQNQLSMIQRRGNSPLERMKLQQFNNTYGTYSSEFDASAANQSLAAMERPKVEGTSGGKSKRKSKHKQQEVNEQNNKLQRCQSTCSGASSTANLVNKSVGNKFLDADDSLEDDDVLDNISYYSSTASQQLQGDDLYPIDCSLQLELAADGTSSSNRPGTLNRRSSIRKSVNQKLDLVKEVQEIEVVGK